MNTPQDDGCDLGILPCGDKELNIKRGIALCLSTNSSQYHESIHDFTPCKAIYSKNYQGGTLYGLVLFTRKSLITLDKEITALDQALMQGSQRTRFVSISDKLNGKVKTFASGEHAHDEHYKALFATNHPGGGRELQCHYDVNIWTPSQANTGEEPQYTEDMSVVENIGYNSSSEHGERSTLTARPTEDNGKRRINENEENNGEKRTRVNSNLFPIMDGISTDVMNNMLQTAIISTSNSLNSIAERRIEEERRRAEDELKAAHEACSKAKERETAALTTICLLEKKLADQVSRTNEVEDRAIKESRRAKEAEEKFTTFVKEKEDALSTARTIALEAKQEVISLEEKLLEIYKTLQEERLNFAAKSKSWDELSRSMAQQSTPIETLEIPVVMWTACTKNCELIKAFCNTYPSIETVRLFNIPVPMPVPEEAIVVTRPCGDRQFSPDTKQHIFAFCWKGPPLTAEMLRKGNYVMYAAGASTPHEHYAMVKLWKKNGRRAVCIVNFIEEMFKSPLQLIKAGSNKQHITVFHTVKDPRQCAVFNAIYGKGDEARVYWGFKAC
jgi:hypothetical protein